MDASHFDRLAQTLRHGFTRRTLAALLSGLALSRSLGSPLEPAEAKKGGSKKKKSCPPCKKKKAGKCKGTKPDGTPCENGGQCQAGRCLQSPPPPPFCTGKTNGTPCENGGTCQSGQCVPPRQPPPPFCTGKNICTSPQDAPPECQASGTQCVCAMTPQGDPFCAATTPVARAVARCGECLQSEVCMNLTGCPLAPSPVGCVQPCSTPVRNSPLPPPTVP